MILEDYLINKNTLALEPARAFDYDTIVIEKDNVYYVRQTSLQLIKSACIHNWCSYDGRRDAVLENTNFRKKVPALINREKHLCAFPTHAPGHIDCKWILCHHIMQILKDPTSKETIIRFYNGTSLTVSASYYTVRKQYERAISCMLHMDYDLKELV